MLIVTAPGPFAVTWHCMITYGSLFSQQSNCYMILQQHESHLIDSNMNIPSPMLITLAVLCLHEEKAQHHAAHPCCCRLQDFTSRPLHLMADRTLTGEEASFPFTRNPSSRIPLVILYSEDSSSQSKVVWRVFCGCISDGQCTGTAWLDDTVLCQQCFT